MPNKKSAMKELRKSKKRSVHNSAITDNLKWLNKQSLKAIDAKKEEAKDLVKKAEKAVDKAIQKGLIKENTGRRRKSRLMKRLNAAFASKK